MATRAKVGLLDELQFRGAEETAAIVAHLDAWIGGGDQWQGPWQPQRRFVENASSMASVHHSREHPLQWNPSLKWARETSESFHSIDYYSSMQTFRWGLEIVELQRYLFPEEMASLSSHEHAPCTRVIPLYCFSACRGRLTGVLRQVAKVLRCHIRKSSGIVPSLPSSYLLLPSRW